MASGNWIKFEGKKYIVGPGERALDAMLRQGAPVKFSCRKGTCRSCMLQATSGDPGTAAVETLPQDYRDNGFFLPCCATGVDRVEAQLPDMSLCVNEAAVAEVTRLAPDILSLSLEPMTDIAWHPGQLVGLMNAAGDVRSYSITSRKDAYFLTLNIRIYPHGAVSSWAAKLAPGDIVRLQGPSGDFTYDEALAGRPLLLIGTGTGGGAIAGIARDAIARGHTGPIHLYHGGRYDQDLYLTDLPQQVTLIQAASREGAATRITDLAFADHTDLTKTAIFLCGSPDMVETARIRAMRAGAQLDLIHADAFDGPDPYMTTENAKLAEIQPDPELWAALDGGPRLTAILTEFYSAVYEDPRLEPFFHRVTKQRAIEKQYNFLQDLVHGTKLYFGEKPFNAHHWMVISNELFDYREKLFFEVVRRYDIPEHLIHRWAALHETFRRDIVKSTPRGVLRGGQEVSLEGYSHEIMDIGAMCDGCQGEIDAGAQVLMHTRTGEIFCAACEGQQKVHAA